MALGKALGGGGGATITVKDEGSTIVGAATDINFVGAGVTVTDVSGTPTVTIPGAVGSAITCRARKSTNTNPLVLTTLTALSLDTEDWDTDTMHSAGTNPSRITIVTNGTYHIIGGLGTTGGMSGYLICILRLNGVGSGTSIAAQNVPISSTFTYANCSDIRPLVAGDYLELCYYSSATTYTLEASAGSQYLSVTKLA
jgi:hypothetical protein